MNRGALLAGLAFIAIGVVFLLDRLDVWEVRGAYVWPVLLIVLGLIVLAGARRREPEAPPSPTEPIRPEEPEADEAQPAPPPSEPPPDGDRSTS